MSWRAQGLCGRHDIHKDIFFPPLRGSRSAPESHYYTIAKMVCAQCPVKEQCSRDGEGQEFGVWGGTTPKERTGSQEPWEPKSGLSEDNFDLLPYHEQDTCVNIPAVKAAIRPHTHRVQG